MNASVPPPEEEESVVAGWPEMDPEEEEEVRREFDEARAAMERGEPGIPMDEVLPRRLRRAG
jgi:hypothetical protein